MKKIAFTIAIVLGMSLGAFAQGGMFGYGKSYNNGNGNWGPSWNGTQDWTTTVFLGLPGMHGNDQNDSPIGTGAALLIGFGAAYALKKRKQNR